MATNSCFLLPSYFYFLLQQLPRWTLWNVFLKLQFRGDPGSNQGPLGLQSNALPLSNIRLNIVNRQSTLSLRVDMELVRKRSCLVLLWFISFSCSQNQPRCFKFPFPGKELLWRRGLAYRRWILYHSALQSATFFFDTTVFVVQKVLGGSQLLFSATMLILYSSPVDAQVTLPNTSLSTNFGTPSFAACTSFPAHEFSATVSSLLVVHNSTKHPIFTRLHISAEKLFFFDATMMFLAFLLRKSTQGASNFFFHTENCFDTGILRTGDKYCTFPLYSRLPSCSTRQSL